MYKKTKNGVEIDSQKADKAMTPRFKRPYPGRESGPEEKAPSKSKKKFGKKKARAQKVEAMLSKARKGK